MTENVKILVEALASALVNDEDVVAYQNARNDYFTDTELLKKVNEYNNVKTAYETEAAREGHNDEALMLLDSRLQTLFGEITANEKHKALSDCEDKLNELLGFVNSTLMGAITGASGCGGNCSSCGGCH